MDRPKILVVEDEQVVAMDMELQLTELGYEVTGIAGTGEEALHCVEEGRPDLVLMDIQLHGSMDGIAAAGEIRRQWEVPVIFVTAYTNGDLVARARETGPYGYLTKPYSGKELNATISVALEQHHLVSEMFAEHGWLRTMLAGMNDGVIATDGAGRVKYLNPVGENLTGWTLSEASGLPIEQVYPLRTEEGVLVEMCQLRRVLSSGESIGRQRFLLTARDGTPVTVEDSAAPIRDAQGELAGAVAVILDVTERRRIEIERDRLLGELERSNADLERFAYAIAHDLQSPVRTLMSFSELLSRHTRSQISREDTELLQSMMDAAGNMHRLIQSLLDYARAGHGVLDRKQVSAAEMVQSVQTDLAGLIGETGARIVCGPLPILSVDPVQFKQLLQNLLANSVNYRAPEQPPRISIAAKETQEGWHFTIADNGQGIAPENQGRIFELLTRLHGSEVQGSGIGLSLCRTIVERHGGKIWAESQGSGQGTAFHFTIARAEQPSSSGREEFRAVRSAQSAP